RARPHSGPPWYESAGEAALTRRRINGSHALIAKLPTSAIRNVFAQPGPVGPVVICVGRTRANPGERVHPRCLQRRTRMCMRLPLSAALLIMAAGCGQRAGSMTNDQGVPAFEANSPRPVGGPLHTSGRNFVTADGHDVRLLGVDLSPIDSGAAQIAASVSG